MKRNIGNKVMRPYNVSSDMRLVARALIELRELQEGEDAQKNFTWYDGLHPDQYDNIVKAVFAVCRENFNEAEGEDDDDGDDLEAPSNAIKLSYDIARLCNVKVTRCIVEGYNVLAEKTRKETKRFLFSPFYYVNWRLVAQVFAVCRENLIEVTQGDDDVDEDDLEAPSNAIKLSYDITYYLFLL
jgi:hypothetical protein